MKLPRCPCRLYEKLMAPVKARRSLRRIVQGRVGYVLFAPINDCTWTASYLRYPEFACQSRQPWQGTGGPPYLEEVK